VGSVEFSTACAASGSDHALNSAAAVTLPPRAAEAVMVTSRSIRASLRTDGSPQVLEAELTEPTLDLAVGPGSAGRLATAIPARVGRPAPTRRGVSAAHRGDRTPRPQLPRSEARRLSTCDHL
jgi:hypothetical protein